MRFVAAALAAGFVSVTVGAESVVPVPAIIQSSVVKIIATTRPPDPVRPWARQRRVTTIEGVGTVIAGDRILTNEHLLRHATRIRVQAAGAAKTFEAKVLHVGPAIDLALLTVEDRAFFAERTPLPIAAEFSQPGDAAVLYPFADDTVRLAPLAAPVVKMGYDRMLPGAFWLYYQVEAAIIPGNSGAPLMLGDRMVGVVRSRRPPNAAFAIASSEIGTFLRDVVDGSYDGKPRLFDGLMTLHAKSALRAFLGLADSVHGAVVADPFSKAPDYPLKTWDVITQVEGVPIDDDGYGVTEDGTRIRIGYFFETRAKDGRVRLTVVRRGVEMDIEVPTLAAQTAVIPQLFHEWPPYFVFGPMVFSKATQEYLEFLDTPQGEAIVERAMLIRRNDPLTTRRADVSAFPGEELVLAPVKLLPHPLSEGCFDPQARVVETVNGERVRNLAHVVELLRDATGEFVVIEFAGRFAAPIVFPREACLAAMPEILAANDIPARASADLQILWERR